jgi:hypothetical protein
VPSTLPRHEQPSTLERREHARAEFIAGMSIGELAEAYHQPWPVVR